MTLDIFPEKLKPSRVILLFKKSDKLNVNNYRSISILTCFTKNLEKIISDRLLNFFNKNSVFLFIFIFISIFILLTRRKATEALYIG